MIDKNLRLDEPDEDGEDQIFAEQVRTLYGGTVAGCMVQAIVIIILALAQIDFATHIQIAAILIYFGIVICSRLLLNAQYSRKKPLPAESQKWAGYYTASIALNGLGWVIAAYIFITTSESMNVIFTALILGGISTGALISLAAHLPAYYALLFPTMLSGIVLYIHVGTSISYYTAALGAILMVFLFVSARRLNAILNANVAMKIEYKYLFSDLAKAKTKTDQLNDNLKTEINERRMAEEKSHHAMELAETANKAKTEFLSSMSHELRTPLNAIMGYGQLLGLSSKDPKDKKFVEEILRGGRHLLALINQVLDLSKIERGQMEVTAAPARAEDIIKDALAMMEPQAQKQDIELDFRLPDTSLALLFADQTRVLQVLLNILSNAIKFNTSGGQVTISAKEMSEQADERYVRIIIADTGKGIPADFHHEIFEPFNRLTHQNSHIEGTGIGLSICKHLVELMDGKIDFQSNENEGSVFWVDLPIDITEEAGVTKSQSAAIA